MVGKHTCCQLGWQIGSPQGARDANLVVFSSQGHSQALSHMDTTQPRDAGRTKAKRQSALPPTPPHPPAGEQTRVQGFTGHC